MWRGKQNDKEHNKFATWIGSKVREARIQAGLTQEQLAQLTYTHLNTIGKIENGKVEPTITTLILIATALEKPITYFLPMPPEYRAAEDELPDWIREAVIHLRRIWKPENQLLAISQIKAIADLETKLDIERQRREIDEDT